MKRNKLRPKGCPLSNKKQLIRWAMEQFGWSRFQAENTNKATLYGMWYKLNSLHDERDRSGLILIKIKEI
jgi:hypothetical protein